MSDTDDLFNFDVTQILTEDRQIVVTETWQVGGQLCRIDGPAVTYRSSTTGQVLEENWYMDGQEHREAAPALVAYASEPAGTPVLEAYKWHGKLHRRDGPALIEWTAAGQVLREEWWIMGTRVKRPGGGTVNE